MTVAVDIDESNAARLEAHLYKMVNVLQVRNATHRLVTRRQLAMIKVTANEVERAQLKPLLLVFSAHVVGISTESLILEVTGTEEKLDGMLELLRPHGVLEMVRTGSLVLERV